MGLWVLLACAGGQAGNALAVPYDHARSGSSAETVQGALDELYVRCGDNAAVTTAAAPLAADTNALAARVQVLELRLEQLETQGVFPAEKVTYDPRKTTLEGKTVQAAVDELEARVTKLEDGRVDHGAPGPELFELRDKHNNLVGNGPGGPGGPGGPNGGKGGDPNGGKGGPPGMGPPNGGGQPGMGPPSGGGQPGR
jgi:hypothetical protein